MSHLTLNPAPFAANAADPKTVAWNETLEKLSANSPPWWEQGAPAAREFRDSGKGVFPKPISLPQAKVGALPSRDAGRAIPTRTIPPHGESKGVFLHIHGGGWVLSHEGSQDLLLEWIANTFSLTVISIGYRLAPEHPFPAGPNDCYDAAEYIVDNARRLFDGELLYIGGQSAGGHLSLLTFMHLLRARPKFAFKALLLDYGVYNLGTPLPSAANFSRPLVLTPLQIGKFVDAATPGWKLEKRTAPDVSPLFADLPKLLKESGRKTFPPALFSVGTADALQDDTSFMATKWLETGSPATVTYYSEAPHGFNTMPADSCPAAAEWRQDVKAWMNRL